MIEHKRIINSTNKYICSKNFNQNVIDKLINWHFPRNYFKKQSELIEPVSIRIINDKEQSLLNANREPIEISSKVNVRYLIYHSQQTKEYKKSCSFIIKY